MKKIALLFGLFGAILRADTVPVEIMSPGNAPDTPQNVADNGYYVGPYTLNVSGVTLLGLCVDFTHHSGLGYSWNGYQTSLAPTGMDQTYVYFGGVLTLAYLFRYLWRQLSRGQEL